MRRHRLHKINTPAAHHIGDHRRIHRVIRTQNVQSPTRRQAPEHHRVTQVRHLRLQQHIPTSPETNPLRHRGDIIRQTTVRNRNTLRHTRRTRRVHHIRNLTRQNPHTRIRVRRRSRAATVRASSNATMRIRRTGTHPAHPAPPPQQICSPTITQHAGLNQPQAPDEPRVVGRGGGVELTPHDGGERSTPSAGGCERGCRGNPRSAHARTPLAAFIPLNPPSTG